MDCKYVRESQCLCFTFHPFASSLFYLTSTKNRLRIVQQNLYTGLVMNQLAVPLRQQNLNVDNYILNFNSDSKQLILTLSNHILVYSLQQKTLILVAQAQQSKTPCFIQRAVIRKGQLFFTATQQHQLFAINISECVRAGTIVNYQKFKIPPEVYALNLAVGGNKLAAICSDFNLRVWDMDTGNALKGAALDKIGEPTCLSFSKDGQFLLIGSGMGWVQVWDGYNLGVVNILALAKQISKQKIKSVAWFHYSGQGQSRRFLVFTRDGNVKLFSFYMQSIKVPNSKQTKLLGKALQLSLLYINKTKIREQYQIRSHQFSNFIYFHPGVLLYMVDYYPRMYYPVITTQLVHSFQSLVPSYRKQIYWQPNFLFVDNLEVKRLRGEVQNKISLKSVVEYEDLKILKMDYRPKFNHVQELPLVVVKGVPQQRLRYKFIVLHYLKNMVRTFVISNICLSGQNDFIQTYKEYSGHTVMFLGPNHNLNPLILILQQDKQFITVLNQTPISDPTLYNAQQQPYLKRQGEIYRCELKIKIQKVFQTPFRNSYVVIYLSQNLVRFSNNIQVQSQLIDYEVYTNLGLRLDYNDIVIDIVWSSRGQIGCVVCLQKVIFITDQLKIIKSISIDGYIIQGQFIGYTLIVTTKVDIQYIDIGGKPMQLFCIQNYQSRSLILGVLADRIVGIQRCDGKINCKVRYFNMMQPLLSGYLNYYSHKGALKEIKGELMKAVIEGMAPYHIVSQQFIALLNKCEFSHFSKYFIQSNLKLYSRSIRASTMNSQLKMQRFIGSKIWLQNSHKILDDYLYYEELKDSSDNYEIQKSKEYEAKLIKIIGAEALHSIKQAVEEDKHRDNGRVNIANNFGEQSLFQVYYDYSEKQNIFVKMQLHPFRASDDREWIGINSTFLQSKVGENDNDVDVAAVQQEQGEEDNSHPSAEQQGEFKDLLLYYRFDDGKGELVDDLSDYNNEAYVELEGGEPWRLLEDEPMELEDKWGKKCPPQFSIVGTTVKREKKMGGKNIKNFSFQIWVKTEVLTFKLLQIGQYFEFGINQGQFYIQNHHTKTNTVIHTSNPECQYMPGSWTNITLTFNKKTQQNTLYLNAMVYSKFQKELRVPKDSITIGSTDMNGQFTQFRLWRKQLTPQQIKDYLRTPLDIVAEKRKRMKMKIKEKKKKDKIQGDNQFFPAFPF